MSTMPSSEYTRILVQELEILRRQHVRDLDVMREALIAMHREYDIDVTGVMSTLGLEPIGA